MNWYTCRWIESSASAIHCMRSLNAESGPIEAVAVESVSVVKCPPSQNVEAPMRIHLCSQSTPESVSG